VRKLFDYPIFLYDAQKVGIAATGEPDENELYPNKSQPSPTMPTCLELYRVFERDPEGFRP
jgi:type I restriction enzyme M protein